MVVFSIPLLKLQMCCFTQKLCQYIEKQYDVRVVRIIKYTGKFSMQFINEEIDFSEKIANHVKLPQLKKDNE